MKKNLRIQILLLSFVCVLFTACDEGKIYPESSETEGKTVEVNITFKGVKAWPTYNYMALATFGDDPTQAILTRRISKPSNDGVTTSIRLKGITHETKTIAIAVISKGLTLVHSFYTFSVDGSLDKETIEIPNQSIDIACFERVQNQVFNSQCITCHGGSSASPAGNLRLTEGNSYNSLVNVKAPDSSEGKMYVNPGNVNSSFIIDVLSDDILKYYNHTDIFSGSERSEILSLIQGWINEGVENN